MNAPQLSVIIITLNEERLIKRCLDSVAFASERIVLDSGSTDRTVEIAKACGATVHVNTDWQGFGVQKNRALALASHDWVLSIDADEFVSAELRQELQLAMQISMTQPPFEVYDLPRRSSYCGQYMRWGGWYPDRIPRLFRRNAAHFSQDLVHERLVFEKSRLGHLQQDLLHESFTSLEQVLLKANHYSSARAKDLAKAGKSASFASALVHGLWAFIRCYFLRLGFLDGRLGFVSAVSNAEGTYYRYLKLWLGQTKP